MKPEEITANIPAHELAIQWDFCHEVIGHDGGIDLHFDNILENATARLWRLVESVHPDVEVGVHLCYGDPGHKHVIEPKDAATCVAFGNKISEMSGRAITWLHFPIPRGWVDSKFYEPLSKLHIGRDTKIYLGLVHHSDGIEGTVRRIMLARPLLSDFGVATECGFGRRDPTTIPQLLQIHRAAAETLSWVQQPQARIFIQHATLRVRPNLRAGKP
jgi:methionine synthase II (cobalamin-independent)